MTIYFALFFLLLCAVIAGFRPKASIMNSSLYSLATVLMVGCAGLRAESVGRDYGTYRIYFNASPDTVGPGFVGQWSSTMPFVDVAYVYLNSLVKKAGLPFEALIFLVALVVVVLYAVFFWKHSRFSAIALIFYFSHAFLNKEMIQIRAGLASVIGLWAFHFWAGDRKRWGSAMMLLAVMTHLAIIVAVIPLLFFRFKGTVRPGYVLLTVAMAISVGYNLSSDFSLFSLVERLALFQGSEYSGSVGIFSNMVTIKQLVILGLLCWLINSRIRHFFLRYSVFASLPIGLLRFGSLPSTSLRYWRRAAPPSCLLRNHSWLLRLWLWFTRTHLSAATAASLPLP